MILLTYNGSDICFQSLDEVCTVVTHNIICLLFAIFCQIAHDFACQKQAVKVANGDCMISGCCNTVESVARCPHCNHVYRDHMTPTSGLSKLQIVAELMVVN